MTITQRVRRQMLDGDADDAALIRLDPHPAHASKSVAALESGDASSEQSAASGNGNGSGNGNDGASDSRAGQAWSAAEHERFLEALVMYPSGPWKLVAAHVGSRTTRQTMTHAQKYRQKIERQRRRAAAQGQNNEKVVKMAGEAQEQGASGNEDAKMAQAAMVALQQAVSVVRDDRRTEGQQEAGVKEVKSEQDKPQDKGDERALRSKVSQAVVSLIQLAEPTGKTKTSASK